MPFVTKEVYEKLENQKKAEEINWEIANTCRRIGIPTHEIFPLVPYLLYKASSQADPSNVSIQTIMNGVIETNEEIMLLVREVLNDNLWECLLQMLKKYSTEEFALAVLKPLPDLEPKLEVSTPSSIIKLSNKLLDVKAGENVADMCCGSGSYIVSAAMEEPEAIYQGYELNVVNKTAAMIRAELLNSHIDISLCDVFSVADIKKMPKYDKIFANYPFGLKLRHLGAGMEYLKKLVEQYPGISKATSSDWIFNSLIFDMLKDNGKAVAIMTNGSTWNSIDIPMRKYFVENGLVECVIALPERMFSSTMIPTTLIVMSHGNQGVRMIDATKHFQQGRRQNEFSDKDIDLIIDALTVDHEYSKDISIEELRKNEYNLNLSRYAAGDLRFENGVPFESVIKRISRGAPCTAKQLDEMVSDCVTNMQYLMLANIRDGVIDDKLPYLSYIDQKYEKYCLKNNSLILSKNGLPYKVAVASVQKNQKILANGNLYIIELDEKKANPYYIKAFFDSEQGYTVLKSITVGAVLPNIGVDKLKKVEIPLPPIEEQNRIAEKYRATMDEIAVIKLRLEKAVNKLHHIFDEESE